MASGYTYIQYGSIGLNRCTTRNLSQEPQWDDSHTDILFMKTTVTVSGYLNGKNAGMDFETGATMEYAVAFDGTGVTTNGYASVREQQIRRQLTPRQTFKMVVGDPNGDTAAGNVLIFCKAAPVDMFGPTGRQTSGGNINLSDIDLNNGPRCTQFVITRIVGDELYSVDATFEVCQLECDSMGNVPNNLRGIISNRWSCTDGLDANLRTTRTYMGHLRVASANMNPQQLRSLVIPPLASFFRRDAIHIAVSEDGLMLNWSVTDTEVAMSAPYPARTWSVTHSVGGSSEIQTSFSGLNTIEVNLTGDTSVNKGDLVELAMYIITAKAFGVNPTQINGDRVPGLSPDAVEKFWRQVVIKSIEVVDIIGDENRIIARATILATPIFEVNGNGDLMQLAVTAIAKRFATPLDSVDLTTSAVTRDGKQPYNRALSIGAVAGDPIEYSSPAALITKIFLSYLQSPCDDLHYTALATTIGSSAPGLPSYQNLDRQDNNYPATNGNPVPIVTVYPTIDPNATQNPYTSPGHSNAAYTKWRLENVYRTKKNRLQLPIARVRRGLPDSRFNPPVVAQPNYFDTSSIAQLSDGQCRRIIRVSAERIGMEPQFPDPDALPKFLTPVGVSYGSFPIGQVPPHIEIYQYCLWSRVRPGTPVQTVTGAMLYRADAEYCMALSREPNPGEQLELGNDMWSLIGRQSTDPSGALTNSDWSNTAS